MKRVFQKKMIAIRCCLLLLLMASFNQLYSQEPDKPGIPHVIVFQGVITEKDGKTIPNGNYDISFMLYDVKEGGNPIWTEVHPEFKIENGIINVLLGKKSIDNPLTVTFDRKFYLDIKINNDINIQNRIELGSTAYSLGSEYAEEVDDYSITTEKFADGSVSDGKIESISSSVMDDISPDPFSVYWTILGNIIWGPERNYIGTIEAKDFVIKTFSIERMRFGPYGRVTLGTPKDTVLFIVIGKTKTQNTFIKGDLGVGVPPGGSRVHVNSPGVVPLDMNPFRVDVNDKTVFLVNKNGRVEITSEPSSTAQNNRDAYPLFLNSPEQGIGIKVEGHSLLGRADNDNNFVSFWNNKGMQGRIEGESYLNWLADPQNIMRDLYIAATVAADIAAMANAPLEAASLIAFSAEAAFNAVEIAMELAEMGVTYESGSGDYAEWLEKINSSETFQPGEIVGIFNGKITKNTSEADQLSCISFKPIVLGNKPPEEKNNLFEKVAFLGQVPVKVIGKVNRGDYIVPSGLNNGIGIAVAPELMTVDEYLKVVGRAWGESGEPKVKYINTAIGFDNAEIIKLIQLENKKQENLNNEIKQAERKIQEAKQKLSEMNTEIEKVSDQLKNPDNKIIKTSSGL